VTDQPTGEVQPIEKFRELVHEFTDAMLVTVSAEGQLRGRPLQIVAHNRETADDLWFVTALGSEKVAEIRRQPHVAVTLADGRRFLSISGDARVIVDAAEIQTLWQESWRLWFPEGPTQGGIALICVLPQWAEYWDRSFLHGLRFAFEAAKGYLRNEKMDEPNKPEDHAKVRLS
jgi:general stress protein 26